MFEIAKELKEFKFHQNVQVEFLKDEKVLKKARFVDLLLDSIKVEI